MHRNNIQRSRIRNFFIRIHGFSIAMKFDIFFEIVIYDTWTRESFMVHLSMWTKNILEKVKWHRYWLQMVHKGVWSPYPKWDFCFFLVGKPISNINQMIYLVMFLTSNPDSHFTSKISGRSIKRGLIFKKSLHFILMLSCIRRG